MAVDVSVRKIDILIGYVSQLLNIGVGLLLLPFSITYLSSDEASLWLLIMTIASSVALLDFGFSQTISRNFSYVLAGASELKREELSEKKIESEINHTLFFNLLVVTKRIYWALGFFCISLLGILGTGYIIHIINKSALDFDGAVLAWAVYVLSITLNIVFLYFVPALLGCGKIRDGYLVNIISRGSMIILSIMALMCGFGLIGLAISYLLSIILSRVYSSWRFYQQDHFHNGKEVEQRGFDKELFQILWHNASKLGLVMVGAFLINRSTALLAGLVLPLELAGSYALTMQVFMVLMSVSQTYFQAHVPMFSHLQLSGKTHTLRKKYFECVIVALVVMVLGSSGVVLVGEPVLSIIKANVTLIPTQMLLLAAFVFLLEMNHSVAATFITTRNSVPFVKASLFSGLSVLALSSLFTYGLNLGVLGLLLGQGISQLCYNNWRWPATAWKMVS